MRSCGSLSGLAMSATRAHPEFFDWRKELWEGLLGGGAVLMPEAATIVIARQRLRDALTMAAQISECHFEGSRDKSNLKFFLICKIIVVVGAKVIMVTNFRVALTPE
jgi:hypothetical protein